MKILPPPLATLICLALVALGDRLLPALGFEFPRQWLVGALLIGAALIGEALVAWKFKRSKTSFTPIEVTKARTLLTTGPYALSRNPMYIGQLLILAGGGLMVGSLLLLPALAVLFAYLNGMQIPREEAALTANFGAEYQAYQARVRRWI